MEPRGCATFVGILLAVLVSGLNGLEVQPRPSMAPIETPARTEAPTSLSTAPSYDSHLGTVFVYGIASYMAASYGRTYLALPGGPGLHVHICGKAHCLYMVSTDAGPSLSMQRAGRVADLGLWAWEYVTGRPASIGLAYVTVEYLR